MLKPCYKCRKPLTRAIASQSVVSNGGLCRKCNAIKEMKTRRKQGIPPKNIQKQGAYHRFPCGCSGILPSARGISNKFAVWVNRAWRCRATGIIHASIYYANQKRYEPINVSNDKTGHIIVREKMKSTICCVCNKRLRWVFKSGITPHIEHNHDTGKIHGFAHSGCNSRVRHDTDRAMRSENKILRTTIRTLEQKIKELINASPQTA